MMKRLPWIPQWKWDMLRFFRWGTVLCPSACPCVERKHCYRKIRTAVGGGGNGGRSGKGRIICSSWGSGGVRRARARRTGGWPKSTAKRNVKAFVLGKSRRWLHTVFGPYFPEAFLAVEALPMLRLMLWHSPPPGGDGRLLTHYCSSRCSSPPAVGEGFCTQNAHTPSLGWQLVRL